MARKPNKSAIAILVQPVANVFSAPSAPADLYPISNLRPQINGVTVPNEEYTGSIQRNGPDLGGKTVSFSFNINLRPPGGATPPLADTWVPGRILRAVKFAEVVQAAAIPVAAEALGVGSTVRKAVLGTTAGTTVDLYKGMAMSLSDNGATYAKRMTAIRSYDATKGAVLVEELSAIPAANYQIPKQLSYQRSSDESNPPLLSMIVWIDGVRYNCRDCAVTAFRITLPASTGTQAAIPVMEVTMGVTIDSYLDEATPAIPSLGATPLWKDGDFWTAYKAVGGSNLSLDFGLQSAAPPNPNEVNGEQAAEITGSTTTVSMTRLAYLKSQLDTLALADAQANHPIFAQYGYTAGAMVQVVVPDARFAYPNIDLGGEFVTETGDLYVDASSRNVALNFPY